MNSLRSLTRAIPLLLCLACLLAAIGCQRQRTPSGENTDISSIVVSSPDVSPSLESETAPSTDSEAAPSMAEAPASSRETPVSSGDTASLASQPVASEPSQPETPPTIPFTVGAVTKSSIRALTPQDEPPPDNEFSTKPRLANTFGAIVIRSAAEYRERFDPANLSVPSDADHISDYRHPFSDYLSKYNETFFEKNALIYMVTYHVQSASLNDYIHSLVRSGNQLTIEYTTAVTDNPDPNKGYIMVDAGGGRQTLIEVNKSDVEGVTEIIPQQCDYDSQPISSQPEWWF